MNFIFSSLQTNLKKTFLKSAFSKDLKQLLSGTVFAQVLLVLISPVLTRLFAPEEFGQYSIYNSISSVLLVVIALRYECAIVLPKNEILAANVFALSIFLPIVVSSLILCLQYFFVVVGLASDEFKALISATICALMLSLMQSLCFWNNRHGSYALISKTKIAQSSASSCFQLLLGYFGTFGGIIVGDLLGKLFATFYAIALNASSIRKKLNFLSWRRIAFAAKKYKTQIFYNLPHAVLGKIAANILSVLIYKLSDTVAGLYFLAYRLTFLPTSVVSVAASQIVFQKLNSLKNRNLPATKFFKKIVLAMSVVWLPMVIFVLVWAYDLFTLFFGASWTMAGLYAKLLLPYAYANFISTTLSFIPNVLGELKANFYIEVVSSFVKICSILIGVKYLGALNTIALYSVVGSVCSLYKVYWCFCIVKRYEDNLNK